MSVFARFLGTNSGGGSVDVPVALAPMSGVSDLGMRRAAERLGASFVVSEMVDAESYARGDLANRMKAEGEGLVRHVVQIAGCIPSRLSEAARRAECEGAGLIDINMGCPAKKVVGGLAGSALMRDLDHATALIRAVIAAVSVPVSVKMRLGWDDDSRNAPELARRVEAEGGAFVTVHGRTRCQFYNGEADWTSIRAVKQAVSIPVIANGDCRDLGDAREMLRRSGADGVMVGRAAVGHPWLVGEIAEGLRGRDPEPWPNAVKSRVALDHITSLLTQLGAEHGLRHARKHLAGYATAAGVPSTSRRYRDLVTCDNPDLALDMLPTLFSDKPTEMAA